ncbi:MAG: hypothetical protein L6R41_005427 [Letrouitia leprolyta]|nr:MAG: hypothetical protein L6R41_005427 [Letrouitia leprolyta]
MNHTHISEPGRTPFPLPLPFPHTISPHLTQTLPLSSQTPKKRSPLSPLSTLLCAPNSKTYIILTTGIPTSQDTKLLRPVISTAYNKIQHIIALNPSKDPIINPSKGWIFNTTIGNYELKVKNAGAEAVPLWLHGVMGGSRQPTGTRKLTYRVLADALVAFWVFMQDHGWRVGEFEIYDSGKEVGFGILGGWID